MTDEVLAGTVALSVRATRRDPLAHPEATLDFRYARFVVVLNGV
jgi:hypothetical protein